MDQSVEMKTDTVWMKKGSSLEKVVSGNSPAISQRQLMMIRVANRPDVTI